VGITVGVAVGGMTPQYHTPLAQSNVPIALPHIFVTGV
jgi:hypothetical protein